MEKRKVNNYVKWWLATGIVLLFFQIFIGGVTRLTGSGLSITKWEIITGTVPPLNEKAWHVEFDKYKQTPQYAKINEGMSLREFKFIYFWEYFHRLWAKMIGFVFLFPFMWFGAKGLIPRFLMKDLFITVGLAILAASFGWIMVASGLVNRPWVNAYKLSFHLILGISVYSYLFWAYLKYTNRNFSVKRRNNNQKISAILCTIFVLLLVQIVFGGWMSGMKAALFYPTWPKIGDSFIPTVLYDLNNFNWYNITNYESGIWAISMVHFLHRGLAYLIVFFLLYYWYINPLLRIKEQLKHSFYVVVVLVFVQVILGITTLLTSIGKISVLLGSLHQSVAILILSSIIYHIHLTINVHESLAKSS